MKKRVEKKSDYSIVLLLTLILLFGFTFYITLQYIFSYYEKENAIQNGEVIEINNNKINATIVNCGDIFKVVNKDTFNEKDEIIIENINSIEAIANNEENSKIKINVKYDISENDFSNNLIASNKSELLVRFSYSYDLENWTYVNNVISTNTSNISPLIGNNYDIAGLNTALNVASNFEIEVNNKTKTKVYWRSETILKKVNDNENNKNLKANFVIEYQKSN